MKKLSHSNVMLIANNLVKQGLSRSQAMVQAWIIVKLQKIDIRVAGVSFGKRQEAIEHLTQYKAADIRVQLVRDIKNQYDHNAVAVVATVRGKGSFCMGYLPRAAAASIAPIMDKRRSVYSRLKGILGFGDSMKGLSIQIQV